MSSFDPRPEEWSDHTWNVIELCGMQYYCDIAWASGGIRKMFLYMYYSLTGVHHGLHDLSLA